MPDPLPRGLLAQRIKREALAAAELESEVLPPPRVEPYLPVDGVYATAVLSPLRLLATFYWGRSQFFSKPLILLDFDVGPLAADSWKIVESRLRGLSIERRARYGNLGCYVEGDHLVQHATAAGMPARCVPGHLVTDEMWNVVCQSAAGSLTRGEVGYTAAASEKMDERPFLDALGVHAGPRPDDPTVAAFLFGVVVGLDPVMARDPKARPPKASRRN